MNDEELLEWIKTNPDFSQNAKLVHEALTRIVIGMKKQGIKCGFFIYFGDESFGLHNIPDEYGDYTHLGKMQDYVLRFSQAVINGESEDN